MKFYITLSALLIIPGATMFAQSPKMCAPNFCSFQETHGELIVSAGNDKMSILIDSDSMGSAFFSFASESASYQIHTRRVNGSNNLLFNATAQDLNQPPREARVSAQDLASAHFDSLQSLHLAGPFAQDAITLLKHLRPDNPGLQKLVAMGLTFLDPLTGGDTKVVGIFYASEYWGCVLGSGDWMGCGDIARAKWGYN